MLDQNSCLRKLQTQAPHVQPTLIGQLQ